MRLIVRAFGVVMLAAVAFAVTTPGCGGGSPQTAQEETPPPTSENDPGQAEAAGNK